MNPLVRTSNTKYKNNVVAAAIACSVLLLLPGCLPQLRPPKPGPCLPQSFFLPDNYNGMNGTENSALVSAAEFFNDPQLIGLIDQALVGNQQLRILAEDIAIANNEIMRRRGAYLPFLSLVTGASVNKYSYNTLQGADNLQNLTANGAHFPTPLPDFLVAGDISWQVDIWRQLRNARDAAGLRFLGTVDGRNYVVTRVVAEVAENYYGLMALDQQLETLDRTIALQEQSLEIAKLRKAAARGTELAVQRFLAEVQKNQSQKWIIRQSIIETENRINFLVGRYPQPVERVSSGFIDLQLHALSVGVPSQLLQNRPDIREAERELAASGLDVRIARANFFPKLIMTGGVGYEAFNTKYLFTTPESLIYNAAGDLVAPAINRLAIKADYMNANAKQLQALYEYQRVILNAFTEVVNRVSRVQNYSRSVAIKKEQLSSLEAAVDFAGRLFQNARVEYLDVLIAQRDRNDQRIVLIETKNEQLAAIVNAYQALGGGWRYLVGGQMEMPLDGVPLPDNQVPAEDVPAPKPAEEVPVPLPEPVLRVPVPTDDTFDR
jgi:outer membrane protein, multidrug efflux system